MSLDNIEIIADGTVDKSTYCFKTSCRCCEATVELFAEVYEYKNIDYEDIELYFKVSHAEYLYGESWFGVWKRRIVWAVKCLLGMGVELDSYFTFRDKQHLADFIEGLQKIQQLEKHVTKS